MNRRSATSPSDLAPLRVVVDTNVLVSAFVFPGGPPDRLWRLGIDGAFRAVTSPALMAELTRVLAQRFDWDRTSIDRMMRHVVRVADVVPAPRSRTPRLRDPDDDELLAVATVIGAAVVTGDRDLLDDRDGVSVEVLTPVELLARLA